MRMIMNENIPKTVIQQLRVRGHDVVSVKESLCGEPDDVILARAQSEQRLVVTQDKDFGELTFSRKLPATCGIILFRLSGSDPESDNRRMLDVIDSREDWPGHFAVVTERRIRIRPLPERP